MSEEDRGSGKTLGTGREETVIPQDRIWVWQAKKVAMVKGDIDWDKHALPLPEEVTGAMLPDEKEWLIVLELPEGILTNGGNVLFALVDKRAHL